VQKNLDLCTFPVTVQLQTNLTGSFVFSGQLVGAISPASFTILGAGPPTTTVSSTAAGALLFELLNDATICVSSMTLRSTGAGGMGIVVVQGHAIADNLWFGAMGGAALDAAGPRSVIQGQGTLIWLFENTSYGAIAEDHALIALPCVLQISGAPNFGGAFVQGDLGGMIDATGSTIMRGSATGTTAHALSLGIVFTGGTGNTMYFPGSSAAIVSGGYYE
jgi:hypothetical protein